MDLLGLSYSDSEPDVDEASEARSRSPPAADYLGLNSSTEDEEEGLRPPLPIDTVIDSYRLSEGPVGPPRTVNAETELGSGGAHGAYLEKRPSKMWPGAKRPRVDSIVGSVAGSSLPSGMETAAWSMVRSSSVTAIESEVEPATGSKVGSSSASAVETATRSTVWSPTGSSSVSAVETAEESANGSTMGSSSASAVELSARSAVWSTVRSSSVSVMESTVESAIGSMMGSSPASAVELEARSSAELAVGSTVVSSSAAVSAVESAVKTAAEVRPAKDPFRPHPLMLEYLGKPVTSALPRRVWRTLRGHDGCANALQWGQPLDASHLLLSASMDGTVRIWDALDQRTKAAAWTGGAHGGAAVRCARWSPEGRAVASGGYDRMLRVTDVETGREVFRGEHPGFVTCLKYCLDPKLVLAGTRGSVECWDTRQGPKKGAARSFREDFQEVQDVEFLPGGNEFLCCTNFVSRDSADKSILAWDFRTGAILSNQIFRERYHCIQLRSHPSESCFMAQTNGNYIALFSSVRPYKMNTKKRLEGHKVEGYWTGFDVSPDGRFVFSGSSDGLLHRYGFHRGHSLGAIRVSDDPCLAVACHPLLPGTVAVADWTGQVRICR